MRSVKRTALQLLRPSGDSVPRSRSASLASARLAIARARSLAVAYADDDWSPLSDITFALLLKRAGIQWQYQPLRGLVEIVWPPICGVHLILLYDYLAPAERRFAVRHGLAHVLLDHMARGSFARTDHDWREDEEGAADLFALADLVPDRVVQRGIDAGLPRVELERWLQGEIWRYVPSWSAPRLEDRAALRLALWDATRNPVQ